MLLISNNTPKQVDVPLTCLAPPAMRLCADLPALRDFPELQEQPELLDEFNGSASLLDEYIHEARRVGKTDAQIKLIFSLMPSLSGNNIGKRLVQLGLFDEIVYNACSKTLLNFICRKDVLLFSFLRSSKLLTKHEIIQSDIMYGPDYFDYEHMSKSHYNNRLRISELDRVLIHFAKDVGAEGFAKLRLAQYNHDEVFKKELFECPAPGLESEIKYKLMEYDYSLIETARFARLVGILFQRFMTEDQLRAADVHKENPWRTEHIIDGALYSLAFPKQFCNLV